MLDILPNKLMAYPFKRLCQTYASSFFLRRRHLFFGYFRFEKLIENYSGHRCHPVNNKKKKKKKKRELVFFFF